MGFFNGERLMSFNYFLSGLAGGAADAFNKRADEQRQVKQRQNELLATSLEKRLENDPDLHPDDQVNLFTQSLILHGVDKKTAQQLAQSTGYWRNMLSEKERNAPGVAPAQTNVMSSPSPIPGMENIPNQVDVSVPSSPFGAMPTRTVGQIRMDQQIEQTGKMAGAQKQATREATQGQLQDHLSLIQQNEGNPEALRYLGALPRTANTGSTADRDYQGVLDADGIKQLFGQDVPPGTYRAIRKADGTPSSFYPIQDPKSPSQGKQLTGAQINKSEFPTDIYDNPINDAEGYTPLINHGKIVGHIPMAQVDTLVKANKVRIVQTPEGYITVPVTETTETIKSPSAFGAMPTAPKGNFSITNQGHVFSFPTQAALDAFKREMKIK
jgi:hypothetical protein